MSTAQARRPMAGFVGFARFVAARAEADGAPRMAAALAYASLLSVVPLLAIALAVLAAFPAFDDIRADAVAWTLRTFAPAIGELVHTQLQRFIANAGHLSAVGIIALTASALMLMITIESTLNRVFRVGRARAPHTRLLVHWTVMTLGPLLLGAALSLQGYVTALARSPLGHHAITPLLALPWPTALTALAFAVLYRTMPNRPVRLADAVAGALAAALLFAGLRWGFGLYVTRAHIFASLYGAMAVLPVFLLWTFLSWLAVLIGAEIAAALPEWRAGQGRADTPAAQAHTLAVALATLAVLHERATGPRPGASRARLLAATAADESTLELVLGQLARAGFVAPCAPNRLALLRDPHKTPLSALLEALEQLPPSLTTGPAALVEALAAARAGAGLATDQPLAGLLAAMSPSGV